MRIIGVTGNIASGKNLVTFYLRQLKYPVFDADACIHYLYENDQNLIAELSTFFPNSIHKKKVDRQKLSQYLLQDQSNWRRLENVVHPVVMQKISLFIKQHRRCSYQNIVLNIPLLFEIKADKLCDCVIVVTSNNLIRMQRLAKRQNYNPELMDMILKRQCNILRNNKVITIKTGITQEQVRRNLYQTIVVKKIA